MFICGLCWIYTKPQEKAFHVITKVREKIYPFRPNANTFIPFDEPGKRMITDDKGGKGFEIVSETLACKACAANPPTPEVIRLPATV